MNIKQEIEQIETLAAWIDNSAVMYEPLFESVVDQLGSDNMQELFETLKDVSGHGANSGFSGFIYSNECLAFFNDNKKEIIELLEQQAEELGIDMLVMVQSFNCLRDNKYSLTEISQAIYNNSEEACIIDAICWFVLEQYASSTDF